MLAIATSASIARAAALFTPAQRVERERQEDKDGRLQKIGDDAEADEPGVAAMFAAVRAASPAAVHVWAWHTRRRSRQRCRQSDIAAQDFREALG